MKLLILFKQRQNIKFDYRTTYYFSLTDILLSNAETNRCNSKKNYTWEKAYIL